MTGEETEQKKKEPHTLHELTGMASEIEDFFIDHKLSIEERQYIISLLQASALANLTMRMLKSSIPKMKVGIVELRPTNMYRHSDN